MSDEDAVAVIPICAAVVYAVWRIDRRLVLIHRALRSPGAIAN